MNYRVHNPVDEQEKIARTLQHVADLYEELCQVLEDELYSYAEEDWVLSSGSEMDHLIMEINEFLARLPKRGLKSRELKPVLTASSSYYVDDEELQEYIDEVDLLGDIIEEKCEDFGYEFRRSRHSNPASQTKCDKLRTKLANAQAKVVEAQKRLDEACKEAEAKPAKPPKGPKPPKEPKPPKGAKPVKASGGGASGGGASGGGASGGGASGGGKSGGGKSGGGKSGGGKSGGGKSGGGKSGGTSEARPTGKPRKPAASHEVAVGKYGRFETGGEAYDAATTLARKILPTHEFPENKHFAHALLYQKPSKIKMGDAESASPVAATPAGIEKNIDGVATPVVQDIQGGSKVDSDRLTGEVATQQRLHPTESIFFAVDPDGNFAVNHAPNAKAFAKEIAKHGFGGGCVIVKMPPLITGEVARDKAYNKTLTKLAEQFCGAFTKSQAKNVRTAVAEADAQLPAGSTPIVPEIHTVAGDGSLVPGVDTTKAGKRNRRKDAEKTPVDAGEVAQEVEDKPKRVRPPRAVTTREPKVKPEPGRRGRPAKPVSDEGNDGAVAEVGEPRPAASGKMTMEEKLAAAMAKAQADIIAGAEKASAE